MCTISGAASRTAMANRRSSCGWPSRNSSGLKPPASIRYRGLPSGSRSRIIPTSRRPCSDRRATILTESPLRTSSVASERVYCSTPPASSGRNRWLTSITRMRYLPLFRLLGFRAGFDLFGDGQQPDQSAFSPLAIDPQPMTNDLGGSVHRGIEAPLLELRALQTAFLLEVPPIAADQVGNAGRHIAFGQPPAGDGGARGAVVEVAAKRIQQRIIV